MASWATTAPLAARRDDLLGPVAVAGEHLGRLARPPTATAKRHGGALGEQRALGRLGGSRTTSAQLRLGVAEPRDVGRRARAHAARSA